MLYLDAFIGGQSVLMAFAVLAVSGWSYGVFAIAVPNFVSTITAPSFFSRVYGKIFVSWGVAGLSAPFVAGYLYDQRYSFSPIPLFADARVKLLRLLLQWHLRKCASAGSNSVYHHRYLLHIGRQKDSEIDRFFLCC